MNRKVHVRFGGRPSEKYLLRQLAGGPPYGEEGLAMCEVALWLGAQSLAVEFAGDTLARYDVQYSMSTKRLREVKKPRLFERSYRIIELRLFELEALGETGWLKALRLEDYAPRQPHNRPQALQDSLFSSAVG